MIRIGNRKQLNSVKKYQIQQYMYTDILNNWKLLSAFLQRARKGRFLLLTLSEEVPELSEEIPDSTIHVHRHFEQLKVALSFPAKGKKRKVLQATESKMKSLSVLTPQSKGKAFTQTCLKRFSPASSSTLSDAGGGSNPLLEVYTAVKRKQDPASSCAKCLILNKLTSKTGFANKVRKSTWSLSWMNLQKAAFMDVDEIIVYYKTTKSTIPKPPSERKEKVRDFYNKVTTLWQLPYKNLTWKIKDSSGLYHQFPVWVMQITLKKAF